MTRPGLTLAIHHSGEPEDEAPVAVAASGSAEDDEEAGK